MPTLTNSAGSPSASEIKGENQSDMLGREVLAVENQNSSGMPTLSESEMTKAEALAILWTGLEALAMSEHAKIYRSQKSGSVWIRLLATDYDSANGLKSIGDGDKSDGKDMTTFVSGEA